MKKLFLTLTTAMVLFSSYGHAEGANYYAKQEKKAQKNAVINTTPSEEKAFITPHLNIDPRINSH